MANTKGFIAAVQQHFGLRATVPFQTPLAIGDIGRIGPNGEWTPVSTTRQRFGVEPAGVRRRQDRRGVWDLSSGKEVKFHVYADGQTSELLSAIADAKARTEINFSSAKSFVFAAKTVNVRSATQMDALIDAIRLAYHNRKHLPEDRRWDASLAFVFAVADAARFVTVLADQAGTTLAVNASGKVGPPGNAAALTARISFGSSSNELQKVNLSNAESCLYRAYRLDPAMIRRWKNERVSEVRFAAVAWQSLRTTELGVSTDRSPGVLFGSNIGTFDHFGGDGQVGFALSERATPSFEETFLEIAPQKRGTTDSRRKPKRR